MNSTASTAPSGHAPARCAACERYIGPVAECPYCGLENAGGGGLRRLRLAAGLLAGIGLLLVYLAARAGEVPSMRIEDLTPRLHAATVRVTGRVQTPPFIAAGDEHHGTITFLVDDGTGTLSVTARRAPAGSWTAASALPREGDTVELVGRLTIEANGKRRLRLHRLHNRSLHPQAPVPPEYSRHIHRISRTGHRQRERHA